MKTNQLQVINELKLEIGRIARLGMQMSEKDISDWLTECNQNTLKGLTTAGILQLVSSERKQLSRAYNGYRTRYVTNRRYILTEKGKAILGE
jgi:hypothetical protein